MSSDSRAQIIARIRGATRGRRGQELERELASLGTAPAAPLLHEEPVIAFMARVLKNQGTLALAASRSAAVKAVGQYVYQHTRGHRLVAGNDPHLAAMPWRDGGVLPRFGEVEPGDPVALSYARLGVAETGATVLVSDKGNPCRNSLLAERHIVIVEAARIVPDHEAMWELLSRAMGQRGRPRAIQCIAGPSSTGDVEATIVYGAHGPRAWHVIVLGEVPEGAEDVARALQ